MVLSLMRYCVGYEGKRAPRQLVGMALVRNLFPPNVVAAAISQSGTVLKRPKDVSEKDTDYYKWEITYTTTNRMNIMGIITFSIVLGITVGLMKEHGRPILDFFTCLGDAMMLVTKWVIWLSPIGVTFLIAGKILEMKSLADVVGQVGLYFTTVLLGLFIHGLIVLPLIYFIVVRKQPFGFMFNMAPAITTAFGTSSSTATLPVTMACIEDKNGIDPRVSRFCLPIGATINMDGTALYEAVATIFIAQIRRVELDIGKIIAIRTEDALRLMLEAFLKIRAKRLNLIHITATAASVGAAGIPQAGLVVMVMVLNSVGLPTDDIALIFLVDWFLDRFRTSVNVMGDSLGAGIVAYLSYKELELPHKNEINASDDASNYNLTENTEINNSNQEIKKASIEISGQETTSI